MLTFKLKARLWLAIEYTPPPQGASKITKYNHIETGLETHKPDQQGQLATIHIFFIFLQKKSLNTIMYWTRVTIIITLNSLDYKSTLHNTSFLKALPSILISNLNLSFIVREETCMESTNDLHYIFWDDCFTIHNICLLPNCNMIYTSRLRHEKWRGIKFLFRKFNRYPCYLRHGIKHFVLFCCYQMWKY